MPVDDLELKALTYVLAREMKKYHHQMLAYRHVIDLVRGSGMPDVDR